MRPPPNIACVVRLAKEWAHLEVSKFSKKPSQTAKSNQTSRTVSITSVFSSSRVQNRKLIRISGSIKNKLNLYKGYLDVCPLHFYKL